VAVSVTVVPFSYGAECVPGHAMPAGLETIEPLPLMVVVSAHKIGSNRALTFRASLIVTVHVVTPLHASPHPMKTEAALGCAVSVTTVSLVKSQAQMSPQSIPAGLDLTMPRPWPTSILHTVNVNATLNVAVTLVAALTVMVHVVDWPAQAPLQPLKTEPALGCAVSVTTVPLIYGAAHVLPQSMPAGLDVTTPEPVPVFETDSRADLLRGQ
jgi:hypothetical protein